MRILLLCTDNSCQSQMAEGFIKYQFPEIEIFSAGIKPAPDIDSYATKVMNEIGIDISKNKPKNVNIFKNTDFEFVITVCNCLDDLNYEFEGIINKKVFIGIDAPSKIKTDEETKINEYRKVRDNIVNTLKTFFNIYK